MEILLMTSLWCLLVIQTVNIYGQETGVFTFDAMRDKLLLLEKRIEELENRNRKFERIEQLLKNFELDSVDILTKCKCVEPKDRSSSESGQDKMPPFTRIKRQSGASSGVAFCAGLSTMHLSNLGRLQTIVFDNVTVNVGNMYSGNTGIFRVPVSGYYAISLLFTPGAKTDAAQRYIEIVSDGAALGDILVDSSAAFLASTSKTWVFHLRRGSEVWVRNPSYNSVSDIHGMSHSMITGWLLFEDS